MSLRRWRGLVLFFAALTVLFCAPFLLSSKPLRNHNDINEYAAPFRHFAARRLQAGDWPLWNPHIFLGTPFAASPQSGLLYPPNQTFWFFPLDGAMKAFTVFHLFLNALGMSLFLLGMGRRRAGPWLGGLAWGFGLFFLGKVSAGHVVHLSGYAWTGFVLLGALAVRASPWFLAAGGALMFFSGHLQVAEHAALLAALLAAAVPGARGLRCRRGLAAAAAAGALVSLQALPSLLFLDRSTRAAEFMDAASRAAMSLSYSLDVSSLRALLFPGGVGHPFDGTFGGGPPSVFFEGHALYIGALPLILGLAGLWSALRRKAWGLPLVAAAFVLLSFGGNGPFSAFFTTVLGNQRAPARLMAGALFVLAWAGAAVLDGRRWRRGLITGLLLLTAADLYVHGRSFLRADDVADRWTPGAVQKMLKGSGPFPPRVALGHEAPMQNKGMLSGVTNVNGYEAIVPGNLVRFFSRVQPGGVRSTTGVDVTDPTRPAFRALGCRYAILPRPVPGWTVLGPVGPGVMSEDPSPQPLLRATGRARILSAARPVPERLDVQLEGDGSYVLEWAERFVPGWKAWAESRAVPVEAGSGILQEVRGEGTGRWTLRWRYRPWDHRMGLGFSLAAWGILGGGALFCLKKLI